MQHDDVDDVEPRRGVVELDVAGEGRLPREQHGRAVDEQHADGGEQRPAARQRPARAGAGQAPGAGPPSPAACRAQAPTRSGSGPTTAPTITTGTAADAVAQNAVRVPATTSAAGEPERAAAGRR